MNDSALSLSQTPPVFVPLIFMLTAPIFSLLAGIVIFIYPEAMQSRWNPAVLSIAHLLVLGFAVMVMLGAIQQLLPVLAGVSFRKPMITSAGIFVGYTSGVVCLCLGLLNSHQGLLATALACLALTIAVFLTLTGSALLRSKANPQSIQGIRFALIGFLISVALGLYLGAGHGFTLINLQRQYTQLHLTWGLLGWIGLLIISVSYQVVPMFQITPRYPGLMVRWLVPGIFITLVFWTVLKSMQVNGVPIPAWVFVAAELLITAGFVGFCITTLYLQSRRKRKLPDVTLSYFRLGMAALMIALAIWWLPASMAGSLINEDLAIGVLLIVGFTMSIISGMLYKIVAFLIWLHLTNEIDMSSRWAMNIPNMKQIIPDRHARWQFWFHGLALALLMVSLCQITWVIQTAAVCLFLSSLYLFRNLISATLLYHRVRVQAPGSSVQSPEGS